MLSGGVPNINSTVYCSTISGVRGTLHTSRPYLKLFDRSYQPLPHFLALHTPSFAPPNPIINSDRDPWQAITSQDGYTFLVFTITITCCQMLWHTLASFISSVAEVLDQAQEQDQVDYR